MNLTSHESFVDYIRNISQSGRAHSDLVSLPTLLLPLATPSKQSDQDQGVEDRVLSWFRVRDFDGDRTIPFSLHGYPGLLRKLLSPAPWVDVRMEDLDGSISPEREHELEPLYRRLAEEEQLLKDFDQYVKEEHEVLLKLHLLDNLSPPPPEFGANVSAKEIMLSWMTQNRRNDFRRLIHLARVLGPTMVDAINEAVFEIDEFPPYTGCPDLLLWTTSAQETYWLFAEVKSWNDHLRQSQIDWMRNN